MADSAKNQRREDCTVWVCFKDSDIKYDPDNKGVIIGAQADLREDISDIPYEEVLMGAGGKSSHLHTGCDSDGKLSHHAPINPDVFTDMLESASKSKNLIRYRNKSGEMCNVALVNTDLVADGDAGYVIDGKPEVLHATREAFEDQLDNEAASKIYAEYDESVTKLAVLRLEKYQVMRGNMPEVDIHMESVNEDIPKLFNQLDNYKPTDKIGRMLQNIEAQERNLYVHCIDNYKCCHNNIARADDIMKIDSQLDRREKEVAADFKYDFKYGFVDEFNSNLASESVRNYCDAKCVLDEGKRYYLVDESLPLSQDDDLYHVLGRDSECYYPEEEINDYINRDCNILVSRCVTLDYLKSRDDIRSDMLHSYSDEVYGFKDSLRFISDTCRQNENRAAQNDKPVDFQNRLTAANYVADPVKSESISVNTDNPDYKD